MSNRELINNLASNIPDSELLPVVDILKSLYRLINNTSYVEEVEPDEWDLKMIEEAEKTNDGTSVTLEELLAKDGLTYADLRD
ncbi:MAG: hypothetical protein ACI4VF_07665 [Lachnospirales bacterium]